MTPLRCPVFERVGDILQELREVFVLVETKSVSGDEVIKVVRVNLIGAVRPSVHVAFFVVLQGEDEGQLRVARVSELVAAVLNTLKVGAEVVAKGCGGDVELGEVVGGGEIVVVGEVGDSGHVL